MKCSENNKAVFLNRDGVIFKEVDHLWKIKDAKLIPAWCIGDKTSDILAGKRAGCRTILVDTGYGGRDKMCEVKPDYKANNLFLAADKIINNI